MNKIMDYKEKYEQALQRAKQFSEKPYLEDSKGIVEYIFPELKESEDERIRKALITFFQRFPYENIDDAGTNVKEVIAWLEKQGKNNIGISEATKQKLEDNLNKALEKETSESWNKFLDRKGEQKPTEWTAEDEEELKIALDTLEEAGQYSSAKWLKNVCLVPQTMQKPAWSEEELDSITAAINNLEYLKNNYVYHPMGLEPAITFLKSLKDRVLTQPKQ